MNRIVRILLIGLVLTFGVFLLRILLFYSGVQPGDKALFRKAFRENYRIFAPPLPEKIEFAGEVAPIDQIHIYEKLDREILVNTYWHSSTLLMFKRGLRYFPVIEKILKDEGIPDDFKYLSLIESNFTNAVSPRGATGFWQFLEGTGKDYGLEVNDFVDERYHVQKSTVAACAYIRDAYEKFGNWTLVAASFNAGMKRISESLEKQETKDYYQLFLNEETSRYIFRILAIKAIFENPSGFGFYLREKDLYPPIPTRYIEVNSSIDNLVDYAISEGSNYMILKTLNPWLRSDKLPVSEGKSYIIELPVDLARDKLIRSLDDEKIFGDTISFWHLSR